MTSMTPGTRLSRRALLEATGAAAVAGDGVTLAADDGSSSFARQASFIRRPGLASGRATSWEAVGARRSFLLHDRDALRVGTIGRRQGAAAATFFLR